MVRKRAQRRVSRAKEAAHGNQREGILYNAEMIRVCMPQKKKEIEIPGPKRVMDLIAETGMRPSTVIVTQEKKLLTKDHRVEDGETVNIISVVSGG